MNQNGFFSIFASLLGLLAGCQSSLPVRETRWTMINVQGPGAQADCNLIEFPDGKNVLIDVADGADAPGTAIAFLKQHKITRVDLVVISHFHLDHYGRLVDLIKSGIKVGRVVGNLPASREEMDREHAGTSLADWDAAVAALQFVREQKIPYDTAREGDRLIDISSGRATVRLEVVCAYDGVNTPVGKTDVNDTSIILRLSHGPTRALFTGDLNQALGAYLAKSSFDLSADVLKVPHHGTEGAAPDEFFARVDPKAALVPAPSTLWFSLRSKRIRTFFLERHIPIYVNGVNGHLVVTMNERGFSVTTERPAAP